jgi:hypothetical protein
MIAANPAARYPRTVRFDVLRAAEAGVTVTDDGYRYGAADVLPLIDELGVRDQPRVRHRESYRGDGETAHEADLEAGLFDEARRNCVLASGHQPDPRSVEQRSQAIGGTHDRLTEATTPYHGCTRLTERDQAHLNLTWKVRCDRTAGRPRRLCDRSRLRRP